MKKIDEAVQVPGAQILASIDDTINRRSLHHP